MIIQAELRRKQSEYEGEPCAVDKVIELPSPRFKQFSRALLADYDFIAENKNAIRHDEDARHCLLILDAEGTDGFLVDPQGYNYARYSAFVPNARSLLTPDMGIDRSYLSPAEPWRDESRDEMLRMTLRVNGKPDYTLVLPADEEYLDAVKNYLDKAAEKRSPPPREDCAHLLNPGEVRDGPPRRTHSIGDLIQRKNGGIVAEFGFLNRSGSHRQTGLPQRESMRSSIPYTFQPTSPQCFFADCFRIAQRNPAARTMASTGSTDLLPQVILASAHPAASNISRALLLSSIW